MSSGKRKFIAHHSNSPKRQTGTGCDSLIRNVKKHTVKSESLKRCNSSMSGETSMNDGPDLSSIHASPSDTVNQRIGNIQLKMTDMNPNITQTPFFCLKEDDLTRISECLKKHPREWKAVRLIAHTERIKLRLPRTATSKTVLETVKLLSGRNELSEVLELIGGNHIHHSWIQSFAGFPKESPDEYFVMVELYADCSYFQKLQLAVKDSSNSMHSISGSDLIRQGRALLKERFKADDIIPPPDGVVPIVECNRSNLRWLVRQLSNVYLTSTKPEREAVFKNILRLSFYPEGDHQDYEAFFITIEKGGVIFESGKKEKSTSTLCDSRILITTLGHVLCLRITHYTSLPNRTRRMRDFPLLGELVRKFNETGKFETCFPRCFPKYPLLLHLACDEGDVAASDGCSLASSKTGAADVNGIPSYMEAQFNCFSPIADSSPDSTLVDEMTEADTNSISIHDELGEIDGTGYGGLATFQHVSRLAEIDTTLAQAQAKIVCSGELDQYFPTLQSTPQLNGTAVTLPPFNISSFLTESRVGHNQSTALPFDGYIEQQRSHFQLYKITIPANSPVRAFLKSFLQNHCLTNAVLLSGFGIVNGITLRFVKDWLGGNCKNFTTSSQILVGSLSGSLSNNAVLVASVSDSEGLCNCGLVDVDLWTAEQFEVAVMACFADPSSFAQ